MAKRTSKKSVKLLSGGNPQIAKADGDAPVQEYIAAMPGWKRDVGHCLDAIIESVVPSVRKEVRYLHIHENDVIDEAQFAAWVK